MMPDDDDKAEALLKAIDRARAAVARLRAALEEIRDERGHVCPEFETCDHAACTDSHAAWEIANEALGAEAERACPLGRTRVTMPDDDLKYMTDVLFNRELPTIRQLGGSDDELRRRVEERFAAMRQTGRTTRDLQRLVKHLEGHLCRGFYVVDRESMVDVVKGLLDRYCGFCDARSGWVRRGPGMWFRRGSMLEILGVNRLPMDVFDGVASPGDVVLFDHHILDLGPGSSAWEAMRRYYKYIVIIAEEEP